MPLTRGNVRILRQTRKQRTDFTEERRPPVFATFVAPVTVVPHLDARHAATAIVIWLTIRLVPVVVLQRLLGAFVIFRIEGAWSIDPFEGALQVYDMLASSISAAKSDFQLQREIASSSQMNECANTPAIFFLRFNHEIQLVRVWYVISPSKIGYNIMIKMALLNIRTSTNIRFKLYVLNKTRISIGVFEYFVEGRWPYRFDFRDKLWFFEHTFLLARY